MQKVRTHSAKLSKQQKSKHLYIENRKGQGEGSSTKRVGRFCDKPSSRKRARKSKKIAATRCVEAGMYLPVQVNGFHTDMLIDSRATASLISVEVFNKMVINQV